MSTLISVYKMYVYDDGRVEIQPEYDSTTAKTSDGALSTNGCSNTVRQIVRILEYAMTTDTGTVRSKISGGVNRVAENENITASSVHAKITRKLGMSMVDFKDNIVDYLSGKDIDLKSMLLKACVSKTRSADTLAIEQLMCIINEQRSN